MRHLLITALMLLACSATAQTAAEFEVARTADAVEIEAVPGRWTEERINAWYAEQPWLVGCNYYPATAINQIDMWQASTWDPEQIKKELDWAAAMGMNTLRVYLHDLVWADDEDGLYDRMDQFLGICAQRGIRPFFVFFDDCHYPSPKLGEQPLPLRAWHNSGWVNSPGRADALLFSRGEESPELFARLKGYVQGTIERFKDDERVLMWDLYNEPGRGNSGGEPMEGLARRGAIGEKSNRLVMYAIKWAREVDPSQPVTINSIGAVGKRNIAIADANTDLYNLHSYSAADVLHELITEYQAKGRPVIVSEWLARTRDSTVAECLPVLHELNAGAINWGFVVGKSQTHYPWESRRDRGLLIDLRKDPAMLINPGEPFPEPDVWFHDLYRMDGTPFDAEEIAIFRELTGVDAPGDASAGWAPAEAPILTRWAKTVRPANAHREYPRPQLRRDAWQNLNGLWDFKVTGKNAGAPQRYEQQILVPFTIEAPLSGIGESAEVNQALWYRRSIALPEDWRGQRVLLHFEASDYLTRAWVNGVEVGEHRGAYDAFSFDITDALTDAGEQELVVRVYDPQDSAFRSLGKQHNIQEQYERCSGIWQTVWLEPVPMAASIRDLKVTPDMQGIDIQPVLRGAARGMKIRYEVTVADEPVMTLEASADAPVRMNPRDPRLWSPDDPLLYDLSATLLDRDGNPVDRVESYFGLRTIALEPTDQGQRIVLNGEPVFQVGPLDQSYWPGGGLTPPSDEAMAWEADYLKRIGCNMVRLHIKVNPRRFYYHCDRKGLLVWQDFVTPNKRQRNPSPEDSASWLAAQQRMMEQLHNHPSIVMWVVFNEEWGQHDSERIMAWAEELDPSRLINGASGWVDVPGMTDIRDLHDYTFRPSINVPGTEPGRAVILGECGGFASAVSAHNWVGRDMKPGPPANPMFGGFDPDADFGDIVRHDSFRPSYTHGEVFARQYDRFIDHIRLLQNDGLEGIVYTQMTDMKREENGYLTFDRELSKVPVAALRASHERLFDAPPIQHVLPLGGPGQAGWQIAMLPMPAPRDMGDGFNTRLHNNPPAFDRLAWEGAAPPFGNLTRDGQARDSANWDGKSQLVLRSSFELASKPEALSVRVFTRYRLASGGKGWIYTRLYLDGELIADEVVRHDGDEARVGEVLIPADIVEGLEPGRHELTVVVLPGLDTRRQRLLELPDAIYFDLEVTEVDGL